MCEFTVARSQSGSSGSSRRALPLGGARGASGSGRGSCDFPSYAVGDDEGPDQSFSTFVEQSPVRAPPLNERRGAKNLLIKSAIHNGIQRTGSLPALLVMSPKTQALTSPMGFGPAARVSCFSPEGDDLVRTSCSSSSDEEQQGQGQGQGQHRQPWVGGGAFLAITSSDDEDPYGAATQDASYDPAPMPIMATSPLVAARHRKMGGGGFHQPTGMSAQQPLPHHSVEDNDALAGLNLDSDRGLLLARGVPHHSFSGRIGGRGLMDFDMGRASAASGRSAQGIPPKAAAAAVVDEDGDEGLLGVYNADGVVHLPIGGRGHDDDEDDVCRLEESPRFGALEDGYILVTGVAADETVVSRPVAVHGRAWAGELAGSPNTTIVGTPEARSHMAFGTATAYRPLQQSTSSLPPSPTTGADINGKKRKKDTRNSLSGSSAAATSSDCTMPPPPSLATTTTTTTTTTSAAAAARTPVVSDDAGIAAAAALAAAALAAANRENVAPAYQQIPAAVRPNFADPVLGSPIKYRLDISSMTNKMFPSVSPHTVSKLLRGEYSSTIKRYMVIDARFGYEYRGGHIRDALNFSAETPEHALEYLFNNPIIDKSLVFIFHCEFSSKRGPDLARFVRERDRHVHINSYPELHYPEIYILEKGYKEFFSHYPELCEPRAYVPMVEKEYKTECTAGLKAMRRSGSARSRATSVSGVQLFAKDKDRDSDENSDDSNSNSNSNTGGVVQMSRSVSMRLF